jgi:hypothetical protein
MAEPMHAQGIYVVRERDYQLAGKADYGTSGPHGGFTIDEARAHARLWAAAPELLDVLRRWSGVMALQTFDDRERFRDAARAAIAKAEGK